MKRAASCAGVSLRRILPEGQMVGARDVLLRACTHDIREVEPGDMFVAVDDAEADGHDVAVEAVQRGAAAVVAERLLPIATPQMMVEDSRLALGKLSQELAGQPSLRLQTVGVTGTHGKTAVSLLVGQILEAAGRRSGSWTSLAVSDGNRAWPAVDCTPEAIAHWMARAAANQCSHVVAEASPRDLARQRYAAVSWDLAVATNIRRPEDRWFDNQQAYRNAQRRLFQQLKPGGCGVINADDPRSVELADSLTAPTLRYGMRMEADVRAQLVERCLSEQVFLLTAGAETIPVRTRTIGDHHIYNCLAAATVGLLQGLPLSTIAAGLEAADYLPSRLQRVEYGQPFGLFLDAAKTPDRLAHALHALRSVTQGRLICVYGADPDAHAATPARLGRVVERRADYGVITSLQTRAPAPLELAHRILDGYDQPSAAHLLPSRKPAVAWALQQARPGDTVLIAGCQPQGRLLGGKVQNPPESRWAQELLAHDHRLLLDRTPAIYPIWRYRRAA